MKSIKVSDLRNIDFFQVPKWLFNMLVNGEISNGAFKMYVLMYDRLRVSSVNGWIDEDGEVYIKYSYDELLEELKANSKTTISTSIKELEKLHLIKKVKKFASMNIYYLGIFDVEEIQKEQETENKKEVQQDDNTIVQENYTIDENTIVQENCTIDDDTIVQDFCTPIVQENCTHYRTAKLDFYRTGKLYGINNNYINNNSSDNNINNNNTTGVRAYVINLNLSSNLKSKLLEFIDYRKEIKKPIKTERTIKSLINRIGEEQEGFKSEEHLIDCIDFAMSNGWQGVFPRPYKEVGKGYTPPKENKITHYGSGINELSEDTKELYKKLGYI